MNYFPRNPPKRTIRGVSSDTDQVRLQDVLDISVSGGIHVCLFENRFDRRYL